jgi:hypothetical protein
VALLAQLIGILSRYLEWNIITYCGFPVGQKYLEGILPFLDLTTDNIVNMVLNSLISLAAYLSEIVMFAHCSVFGQDIGLRASMDVFQVPENDIQGEEQFVPWLDLRLEYLVVH